MITSEESSVVVQTALDFTIKEEPIDEEFFHSTTTVPIHQEQSTSSFSSSAQIHTDYKDHLKALKKLHEDQKIGTTK